MTAAPAVLALNEGSSSFKFALFDIVESGLKVLARGVVDRATRAPRMIVRDGAGTVIADRRWDTGEKASQEAILDAVFAWTDRHLGRGRLGAVGHRVVHGGSVFTTPIRIDAAVLERLADLCPLAPLHQPKNLSAIRWVAKSRPALPQIACFDTAFHAGHDPVVTRFGLPRCYEEEGVRRYGFHGLSYEYVAARLTSLAPSLAAGRVIIAHLGSGASLCAVLDGRSVDTTMGMTPLDGLVMATRSGAIDPGVIPYLQRRHAMTCDEVEEMLYHRSGMLGVSSLSGDMRELLASDDSKAKDAVELFTFRIAREAAALACTLGGLDGVVFTGGIGENSPQVRAKVGERLAWLGVAIDEPGEACGERSIGRPGSRAAAWVIPTDEERMVAVHVQEMKVSGASQAPDR